MDGKSMAGTLGRGHGSNILQKWRGDDDSKGSFLSIAFVLGCEICIVSAITKTIMS
jgi:hypothetical protein